MSTHHTSATNTRSQGFALLFAVLTGGMLLAVGLAIFNIALKELDLSTAGRESQYAFYAADSGLECALYHDVAGAFPDNSESTPFSMNNVYCSTDQQFLSTQSNVTTNSAVTVFTFKLPQGSANASPCAVVTVEKTEQGGGVATRIISRGYNTCRAGSQQVERALQAVY